MDNANVVEAPVMAPSQISLLGVLSIPAVKQVLLLIGVAAAVAMGFAVVLWSQSPGYTQLYGALEPAESAQVADALRSAEIDYKVGDNGAILVPGADVHTARMEMATQGLSPGASMGMSAMQDQSSFGVSQFMESARYKYATEMELAKTIAALSSVYEARVHLALPKGTAFLRETEKAKASVVLQLFRGRSLEADQASGIAYLVASSVNNLSAKDVTIIDQNGRLLNSGGTQSADAIAATELKYTRDLEDDYKRRIENLLAPILGAGRVSATVNLDIDFTYVEETRESYDPNRSVIRSEQVREDQSTSGLLSAGGVPGALTNQPPEAGGVAAQDVPTEAEANEPRKSMRSSTRNFEVDRTIRHTRPQSRAIRGMSVAVIIDDTPVTPVGEENPEPTVSAADIERYTALVKEAVGFDEARGDTVVLMSEAFYSGEEPVEVESPAIWESPMVQSIARQSVGVILALVIAFGVVRPMLRNVVTAVPAVSGEVIPRGTDGVAYAAGGGASGGGALPAPSYDEKVAAVRNMSGQDPARVAQVVKKWVATDD